MIRSLNFSVAARVFLDPDRIEIYDEVHSIEERYNTIGMVNDILFVVYTERIDRIRIISARIATKQEKEVYNYGKY
ncbi:MAG: BrnT family toxin [Lachnospiraceae bacterium]